MATMKAIRIHSYGGTEVLTYEDIPIPQITEDEMLVRVYAAGINPVDWKVRQGYLKDFLSHSLPFVPGWDVAGVVDQTGPKVSAFSRGHGVYAFIDLGRNGGYAEFCVVKPSEAAFKPQTLDYTQAAAVPLAALTAWQALFDLANLQSGQKVLIHGAAGGVGHFAVQFAKWAGAHIVGTASRTNHEFLLQIGAHECIDYNTTRFEKVAHDIDVVLDTISGETRERSWQVLKKGGILVTTLPPLPPEKTIDAYGVKAAAMLVQPNSAQLGEIAELIDSGHVIPHVQTVLPLQDAARGHALSEAGHVRGKIVLKTG